MQVPTSGRRSKNHNYDMLFFEKTARKAVRRENEGDELSIIISYSFALRATLKSAKELHGALSGVPVRGIEGKIGSASK